MRRHSPTKYRQGGKWVVSSWDPRVSSYRLSEGLTYPHAIRMMREAREEERERTRRKKRNSKRRRKHVRSKRRSSPAQLAYRKLVKRYGVKGASRHWRKRR